MVYNSTCTSWQTQNGHEPLVLLCSLSSNLDPDPTEASHRHGHTRRNDNSHLNLSELVRVLSCIPKLRRTSGWQSEFEELPKKGLLLISFNWFLIKKYHLNLNVTFDSTFFRPFSVLLPSQNKCIASHSTLTRAFQTTWNTAWKALQTPLLGNNKTLLFKNPSKR